VFKREGEVCRLKVVAGVERGVPKISKCQTPVVVSSDGVGVGVGLGDQKETKCKVLCRQHQINVVEIIFIQCKCVGYDA
jgi:hypothetical protein